MKSLTEEIYVMPGSYGQQHLWLTHQIQPETCAYHMPAAFRLSGRLDHQSLLLAINALVSHHEILRTAFTLTEEQISQVIYPEMALQMPVVDLSNYHHSREGGLLQELRSDFFLRPFDLNRLPLLRVVLLRFSPSDHQLLIVLHHIIADGWSVSLIIRELIALYHTYSRGELPEQGAAKLQYADFALWQRGQVESGRLDESLLYWKRRLSDPPAQLHLGTDYRRPALPSFSGSRVKVGLGAELSEGLREAARNCNATEFMALLAALDLLAHRYSGQPEIILGAVAAGREREELEEVVGLFAKTLVIRTRIDPEMSLRSVVLVVKEAALEAYANQMAPLEKALEEVAGQEGEQGRRPQLVIAYNNIARPRMEVEGLEIEQEEAETDGAKFDLMLSLQPEGEGIGGWVEYNKDLYREETVVRIWEHYRKIVEEIWWRPESKVRELQVMSESERGVIEQTNETCRPYEMKSIAQLIRGQAMRTPEAVGVVAESEQVSYGELDRRGNRLGRYLKRRGVRADEVVGVMMRRGVMMVEGLLGVIKAGGAYLPLEGNQPGARIRQMLEQSGVKVVVSEESVRRSIPEGEWEVVSLDGEEEEKIGEERGEEFESGAEGENLAYVIYTSGSTGAPKGVMISHRAISNHLQWRQDRYPLTQKDRFLQKASLSFDISVWEIFGTLSSGACLVIADEVASQDSRRIARLMAEKEVTVAHFSPGLLQVVLEEPELTGANRLRQVYCGGEELGPKLIKRFYQTLSASLTHQYGPTEATVDATVWDCDREESQSKAAIGGPIANTRIHIIDDYLQLAPLGIAGEIYIAGEGLARGYIGRGDLTAERFVPDPFSQRGGERIYRTGDYGRYLADGRIEYGSRRDHQVKVRGYRVELGEIEIAIRSEEGVREAVVAAEGDGEARVLVCYIEGEVDVERVKQSIAEKLPGYMSPTRFERVERMPRLVSGKIDRLRLRGEAKRSAGGSAKDELEESVMKIWREVLKRGEIGAEESFLEAGGNSLLGMQLAVRVRRELGVELGVKEVFEGDSIRGICELMRRNGLAGGVSGGEEEKIKKRQRGEEEELSHAQQRLWFLDQLAPGNVAYNASAAIRLTGLLNVSALGRSFNEIVRRHEILRTTFPISRGRPTQAIAAELNLSLPVIDLGELSREACDPEIDRLISIESQRPFDLAHGPLLRVGLLRITETEHVMLLNMHHIISDGWSTAILIKELATFYEAHCAGRPPVLPNLPIQYADFAYWHREWLKGKAVESHIGYWTQLLKGAPTLALPSDIPCPQVRTSRGSCHSLLLSDTLTSSLITMGTSKDVTLFMILLTAFQILLHYYSRQCDIVVGTDVAGRNRAEIEGLIGMFTNEVVVRTDLAGNPTVNELLYRVRKTALDAYEHQDLPIDVLVEALNPERRLGANPLFQVKLVHNNMPIPEIDLGGLAIEPIYFDDGRIICDLLLETRQMNGRVICKLKYSVDLFESYTIKRMLEQYGRLLQSMVTGTDLTLSELVRILEEDDKRQFQVEREQLERTNTHNRKNIKRRPVSGSISSDGAKL